MSLTRDGQFQYLVGKIDLQRSLNQYLQVLLKHRTEYTILLYTIILIDMIQNVLLLDTGILVTRVAYMCYVFSSTNLC